MARPRPLASREGSIERTECTNDGLPPGEGALLACSFWYVDNLALAGRGREARAVLERLLEA